MIEGMIVSPTALETAMATLTLTKDTFESTIEENDIVLLLSSLLTLTLVPL